MAVGLGIALIALGASAMAFELFGPWRRLPPAPAFAAVVAGSLAIGSGALLVQDRVGRASWVITLVLLGVVGPLHARLVFGPPGSRR